MEVVMAATLGLWDCWFSVSAQLKMSERPICGQKPRKWVHENHHTLPAGQNSDFQGKNRNHGAAALALGIKVYENDAFCSPSPSAFHPHRHSIAAIHRQPFHSCLSQEQTIFPLLSTTHHKTVKAPYTCLPQIPLTSRSNHTR